MVSSTESFFIQYKKMYLGHFRLQSEIKTDGIYYGSDALIAYTQLEDDTLVFFIENAENRKNYQVFYFSTQLGAWYTYNPQWSSLIPADYKITKIYKKNNLIYALATNGNKCIQLPSRSQSWNLDEPLSELQSPSRESKEFLDATPIYSCEL